MFGWKLSLKVLSLFVLVLPVMWIVLDPAGQRWADVTLLRVMGNPTVNLDFAALTGNEDLEKLRSIYPRLQLQCDANGTPGPTSLTQNCFAHIAALNGLPARYLTFFIQDGRLKMVKVHYRAAYHEAFHEQLSAVYGPPVASGTDPASKVVQWRTGPGTVVMKAQVGAKGDNQLFWLRPGYERDGS